MRLVIIGLDGLDPDLVEKWEMEWFKLKVWGRHYVGFFKYTYTPIVWGSFLTGVNVEEHGYDIESLRRKRSEDALKYSILKSLYRLKSRLVPFKLGLRKVLVRLGLAYEYPPSIMPKKLLRMSFTEELKSLGYRVAVVEVPAVNESRNEYYRGMVPKAIGNALLRDALVDEALADTGSRISKAIGYVVNGYDLVFTYSPLPDIAFHLAPKPRLNDVLWLRVTHYRLWCIIERLVRTAINRGYAVLIVSDHGFDIKRYDHSKYGYWSLSIDAGWKINTVLDFKQEIVNLVIGNIDLRKPLPPPIKWRK